MRTAAMYDQVHMDDIGVDLASVMPVQFFDRQLPLVDQTSQVPGDSRKGLLSFRRHLSSETGFEKDVLPPTAATPKRSNPLGPENRAAVGKHFVCSPFV